MSEKPLPPGDDQDPAPSDDTGEDNAESPAVVPPDFEHPGADA